MFCAKCGTKLEDDARFCPECGTKVQQKEEKQERRTEEVKPQEPQPPQNPKNKKPLIIGITVFVAVIVVGVLFFVLANRDHPDKRKLTDEEIVAAQAVTPAPKTETEAVTPSIADTPMETPAEAATPTDTPVPTATPTPEATIAAEVTPLPEGAAPASISDALTAQGQKNYAAILQQYREQRTGRTHGDDFDTYYPDVNRNVLNSFGSMDAWTCYTFVDIDYNGVAELFIAYIPEGNPSNYTMYDMYTYADGHPIQLFDTTDMGTLSSYYICENGNIMEIHRFSNSTWYGTLFYDLRPRTSEMNFVDGCWIYPSSADGPKYQPGDECLFGDSDYTDVSYYEIMMEENPLKTDLKWLMF